MAYYICDNCSTKHFLFGQPTAFLRASGELGVDVLGVIPLEPAMSESGDRGMPVVTRSDSTALRSPDAFFDIANQVLSKLESPDV